MHRAHLPNVLEQEGLVGLTLLCVIMELSNVLHPGTYGDVSEDLEMNDMERLMHQLTWQKSDSI